MFYQKLFQGDVFTIKCDSYIYLKCVESLSTSKSSLVSILEHKFHKDAKILYLLTIRETLYIYTIESVQAWVTCSLCVRVMRKILSDFRYITFAGLYIAIYLPFIEQLPISKDETLSTYIASQSDVVSEILYPLTKYNLTSFLYISS